MLSLSIPEDMGGGCHRSLLRQNPESTPHPPNKSDPGLFFFSGVTFFLNKIRTCPQGGGGEEGCRLERLGFHSGGNTPETVPITQGVRVSVR